MRLFACSVKIEAIYRHSFIEQRESLEGSCLKPPWLLCKRDEAGKWTKIGLDLGEEALVEQIRFLNLKNALSFHVWNSEHESK